jgi:hypothetical protein
MSQKKTSKEEQFLLKLYEFASAKGDPQHQLDRYVVGAAVGERTKGVNHTVQILTKNGLLKKTDEKLIQLTQSGVQFVREYLI